jgi:hypothetical protein
MFIKFRFCQDWEFRAMKIQAQAAENTDRTPDQYTCTSTGDLTACLAGRSVFLEA